MEEENRLTIEEIKVLEKDSKILKNIGITSLIGTGIGLILDLLYIKMAYNNGIGTRIIAMILAIITTSLSFSSCELARNSLVYREYLNSVIKKEKELIENDKIR